MPPQDAHQHHRQDDRANGHVSAVKAREHEEGGAVDARAQRQPQLAVGVDVLLDLQDEEGRAEQHGQPQAELELLAIALLQRMVRPGQGEAGADQQDGIDQRQAPGADGACRCRVEFRVGVVEQRPAVLETGPEHVADALVAFAAEPGANPVADVEQRTEEGGEEHHFGEDEPGHAPAERAVHLRAVEAGTALAYHGAEPAEHHVGDQQRADEEDQRPVGLVAFGREVVEPAAQAVDGNQQRQGRDDRPFALGGNVVLLMAFGWMMAFYALMALGAHCRLSLAGVATRAATGGLLDVMSNNV